LAFGSCFKERDSKLRLKEKERRREFEYLASIF
jgi:hypothetical protein